MKSDILVCGADREAAVRKRSQVVKSFCVVTKGVPTLYLPGWKGASDQTHQKRVLMRGEKSVRYGINGGTLTTSY